MGKAMKRILLAVVMLGALFMLPGSVPPARATHTCYIHAWEGYNYSGADAFFPCPGSPGQVYTWYDLRDYGLNDRISSFKMHLPDCRYNGKLYRDVGPSGPSFGGEGLWGPPYGPGEWNIADLRPYGWDESISAVRIYFNHTC